MTRGLGLTEALLPLWPSLEASARDSVARDVVAFVRAELRLAPFHVRVGLAVLAALFSLYVAVATSGRGLGPLADAQRNRLLAGWERLGGNAARSFLRVMRSLTLLAFFDHPAVLAALGAPVPEERQHVFRERRAQWLKETNS